MLSCRWRFSWHAGLMRQSLACRIRLSSFCDVAKFAVTEGFCRTVEHLMVAVVCVMQLAILFNHPGWDCSTSCANYTRQDCCGKGDKPEYWDRCGSTRRLGGMTHAQIKGVNRCRCCNSERYVATQKGMLTWLMLAENMRYDACACMPKYIRIPCLPLHLLAW